MALARPSSANGQTREALFDLLSRELRCTLDEEGQLLHLEGAWKTLIGWEPAELRGWYLEEILHPGDRVRVAQELARLVATQGCERELEMRIAVPTRGYRLISWSLIANPAPDHSIVAIGRDPARESVNATHPGANTLADHRHRELLARIEELEERSAAADRFAAAAAHQLAEPLVIAESSAVLVAEELGDELDPDLRSRLDAIGRSAARARSLMDALLEDARSAAVATRPTAVDLATIVEETLAAFAPRIEEQQTVAHVSRLPRVRGDRRLLAVVFDNLVSNALKHGPRHGGTIAIAAEEVSGGWRLSVTSSGPPIVEADARRIFEPFLRLPGERRVTGSGLGLAICARLVARMGGKLEVRPGRERGNTFNFVLPAA